MVSDERLACSREHDESVLGGQCGEQQRPASPSGQLFNGSGDFVIAQGGGAGPERFLFSGLNGTIMGWNPGVPPPPTSTVGVTAATGTPAPVAYTGLAAAQRTAGMFLYAANKRGRPD